MSGVDFRSYQPSSLVMYLDRSRWHFPTIRGMGFEKSEQISDELEDYEVGGSTMRIHNFQGRERVKEGD